MERVLQQLVGQLHGRREDDSPLGKAQALMYQAFEERDERRRLDLAKKALEICRDCADAYVLLAEHAPKNKRGQKNKRIKGRIKGDSVDYSMKELKNLQGKQRGPI